VITLELAIRLRDAGLVWTPTSGDRFAIPDRDLDGQVFVVSEMTIDTQELPTGAVMKFNGTTEWALDSVTLDKAIWLPREDQLRDLLGHRFLALTPVDGGWCVTIAAADGDRQFSAEDAEDAYALALLSFI
jgi:hypothetical protein